MEKVLAAMPKIGLIFQLIGFLMLFWDTELRPLMDVEKGGGLCLSTADKKDALERVFSMIPGGKFLSEHFHLITALFFIIGFFLQILF
jgi:hypothetical protein